MLHILLDTDIGNDMDDMQALAYLLAQPDADILGLTTVTGEARERAALADMMCRLAGRGDMPIHAGAETGLSGAFRQSAVSPKEKALLDDFPHASFAPDTAVKFLRQTIEAHPGEITLCCIGPLTNIAQLFEKHPHIPALLKTLIVMGGRFGDVDTARWGVQEWNILNDPIAAKIVFDAPVREAYIFGVEQTSRAFRTDTARVADSAQRCPALVPFSRAIRTSREAWYHDVIALMSLFDDAGMAFARGKIDVTAAGDTRFTPCADGAHRLLTQLNLDLFFSHFFNALGIEPVSE